MSETQHRHTGINSFVRVSIIIAVVVEHQNSDIIQTTVAKPPPPPCRQPASPTSDSAASTRRATSAACRGRKSKSSGERLERMSRGSCPVGSLPPRVPDRHCETGLWLWDSSRRVEGKLCVLSNADGGIFFSFFLAAEGQLDKVNKLHEQEVRISEEQPPWVSSPFLFFPLFSCSCAG